MRNQALKGDGHARRITLAGQPVDYRLIRARRRTIGMEVDLSGLTVRAPRWVTMAEIEEALQERAQWIVRALAEWREALKLRPDSYTTWRSKGDTLNRLGRADEAAAAWRQAASLADDALAANPGNVQARGFLAVCRAKLGDVAAARSLAAQALKEAPQNPEVIYRNAVVATLTASF